MDIAKEVFQQNKPVENTEFSNKEITGEGVANIIQCGYITKKDGDEIIILKASITHPVARDKEEDNIAYGDEVVKFYDPTNEEKMKKLQGDLFTAGVPVNVESDEAFRLSLVDAVNTFIYVRCWIGQWKDKTTGEDRKFQNVHILSKSKVTPELIEPLIAF